jgi:hypothetical protein
VCDLAYLVLLEYLERQVLADRQVAATYIAAGAKDVKMPAFWDRRREFDASLTVEPGAPQPEDDREELWRLLGASR